MVIFLSYNNVFQNPQMFCPTVSLYPEQSTLVLSWMNYFVIMVFFKRTECSYVPQTSLWYTEHFFLGIHKLFHCAPNVPHYAKNKAVGVMKTGNAFTIEPMISEGVWTDQTWPDNWTAVTTDGKLSAQVRSFKLSFSSMAN
jgi:hypothetical protein